jgi:hypothetical protein
VKVRATAVAFAILVPSIAAGHEIGTTTVHLKTEPAGHWIASITTAPQALLNRLEVEAGHAITQGLDAAALRGRLEPLLGRAASHVDMRFDGTLCLPVIAIDTLEVPADITRAAYVVLTASCDGPANPSTVTWRDDLVYSTYAVVLEHNDGMQTVWIEGDAIASLSLQKQTASRVRAAIVGRYLRLGFEHILPKGLDHILFVLGIFLMTRSVRPTLVEVTGFTLAHSVTFASTMYGVVSLPPAVVELLIAISIAYIAVENIVMERVAAWRPATVFAFGLLHGMGFADVLRDLPLPRASFVPALMGFNVGMELAQLAVIALAFICIPGVSRRDTGWYRERVVVPVSAATALTALMWTVERLGRL